MDRLMAAWTRVTEAYAQHEVVRHVVTFAIGVFLGGVFL